MQRAAEAGLGITYLAMFGEVTLRRLTGFDATKEWSIGVTIDGNPYLQIDKDLLTAINRLIKEAEEVKDVSIN